LTNHNLRVAVLPAVPHRIAESKQTMPVLRCDAEPHDLDLALEKRLHKSRYRKLALRRSQHDALSFHQ
jgi:hypothetical protein